MLKNYIKIAWRNLVKNKTFSLINIFGLSVGLACCMLICAYLYQELTYDTYPVNAKQLYRVGLYTSGNGSTTNFPMVDVAVGPGMKTAYPQILASTRLQTDRTEFITYHDKQLKKKK